MIPSIEIKNYRNLKDFNIKSFGRVNLIGGKNNTGKSSILEALWLFNTGGAFEIIRQIIEDRGEALENNNREMVYKAIASLFYRRLVTFNDSSIRISYKFSNDTQLFQSEKALVLRLVRFVEEREQESDSVRVVRRIITEDNNSLESEIGLNITIDGETYLVSVGKNFSFRYRERTNFSENGVSTFFIKTQNAEARNSYFWDKIALTEKEVFVIQALQIIEPLIERVAFVEGIRSGRNAVVKLQNNSSIVPLRSMGDGINRILTIILALVNAENGYLLIDEFENGLHYSVQSKLWEIVFFLSEKLNIQVFATTHSNDCVAGFTEILNKADNQTTGRFIRLENKNGEIKEVDFDKDELKIAMKAGIEIR